MTIALAFIVPATIIRNTWRLRTCPRLRGSQLAFAPTRRTNRASHLCRFRSVPYAASTAPSTAIAPGTLIEIQTSARRRLGRVIRPDGKKNWFAEDAAGQTISVSPKQIRFIIGNPSESPDLDIDLTELYNIASAKADSYADLLETAWELVTSGEADGEPLVRPIAQLAEIIMDEVSPIAIFATYILLTADPIFFKEKHITGTVMYEARTAANIAELRALHQARELGEKKAVERQASFILAFEQRNLEAFKHLLGANADEVLQILESMALELGNNVSIDKRYGTSSDSLFHQLSNSQKASIKEIFSVLSLPITPSSALRVLITLRVFKKHENIFLRASELSVWDEISDSTRLAIEQLIQSETADIDVNRRVDLTHFSVIAIDSADTTEVDDAFSWDASSDTLHTHIADPLRYFPTGLDEELVQEAMRRTTTVYLPYKKMTMFPEEVAKRRLSLNGDLSDGSALTFSFRILNDGSIDDSSVQIRLTTISKPVRLTYEEADASIKNGGDEKSNILSAALQRMLRRRNWREMEGGAIMINNPVCNIIVRNVEADEPEMKLNLINTCTNSWLIVSELMITTCMVGANVASKNGLVVPFRGQEPFDYPPDEVLNSKPDGPVRATLAFRNASPTVIRTEPMEHASLGADSYLQLTSPIRRSLDLVAHMQFKAWLRGDTSTSSLMLSEKQVMSEISRSQSTGRIIRSVENRTTRYWQLEFLRRCNWSCPLNGVFLKNSREGDGEVGVVYLDDFGFTIPVKVSSGLNLGDKLEVQIRSVDARSGMVEASGTKIEVEEEWQSEFEDMMSDISDESLNEVQ